HVPLALLLVPNAVPLSEAVNRDDGVVHCEATARLSSRTQIRSAKLRSMRRKHQTPRSSNPRDMAIETVRVLGSRCAWLPRMDQRNPSMTPTSGFSEYSSRQRSGTSAVVKATGET